MRNDYITKNYVQQHLLQLIEKQREEDKKQYLEARMNLILRMRTAVARRCLYLETLEVVNTPHMWGMAMG